MLHRSIAVWKTKAHLWGNHKLPQNYWIAAICTEHLLTISAVASLRDWLTDHYHGTMIVLAEDSHAESMGEAITAPS